ncbi:SCO6745 family protein [Salinactinospora qingdaonensis]|uniref:EvbL n=1 Tax=Salinactinospora qingdaonensis TaxID=702744 RepID=A0ABP7FKI8_9ACTN
MNDTLSFVRAACPVVHRIGGAWFFTEDVAREGAKVGVTDRFALYAAGRGGVLGDCHPDVVASAFAFFPPQLVAAKYREGIAATPPMECARAYAAGLAAWGDRLLGDLPGVERLADFGRRIADSVRPMGLPLFAGWRALPAPSGPGGAAALALQVLRELRGDLHIHAVVAKELTPLEAILGKDGPERARELSYPEPYPPIEDFVDRREAAEDLTDRLVAPAYAVLDATERSDFLSLLRAAEAATLAP